MLRGMTVFGQARFRAAFAALLALAGVMPRAAAQMTLVPWNQTWCYLFPSNGMLPPGSGATEPSSGAVRWYAVEPEFAAGYSGPSFCQPWGGGGDSGWLSGLGAGPLGYGEVAYWLNDPQAEFQSLATYFPQPSQPFRYGAYFRTTFSVPDDGAHYAEPVLRYLMDDGGWVYLDGMPILRINMPDGAEDKFTALASNSSATEELLRSAKLSAPAGTATGDNPTVMWGGTPNAWVLTRVARLCPGEHTLAVSVHNSSPNSADMALALQLNATGHPDTDRDGMTDAWEAAHGFDPENPTDGLLDPDGDGGSNAGEFLAGTDPRNPASWLRVTQIALTAEGLQLTWSSVTAKVYRIEALSGGTVWVGTGVDYAAAPAPAVFTSSPVFPLTVFGEAARLWLRVRVAD